VPSRFPRWAHLRVRTGLHTCEAEYRDGDYYGSEVNRAARLMSVAHGGQVGGWGTASRPKRPRRRSAYPDSSDRLKDLRVRVRSAFASNAAAGFMNRIQPKSSPTAM
jgi:hypothetical protein